MDLMGEAIIGLTGLMSDTDVLNILPLGLGLAPVSSATVTTQHTDETL
jgi:hypothetical protein